MADAGSSVDVAKAIADPLSTFIGWLAGRLPEGPARTLLYVVVGLCAAVAPFVYRYYLGVLAQGAAPEGSLERQDYDKLRAGLAGGSLAARLYAKWLTPFLDGVERFFGDAGMANRTLFPRAFGLKKPAPLWTAPAFDRCLLLALLYPITTVYLIWAISGDVGPAEAALNLKPGLSGGSRGLIVATGFMSGSFAFWINLRAPGWKSLKLPGWKALGLISGVVGVAFGVAAGFAGSGIWGFTAGDTARAVFGAVAGPIGGAASLAIFGVIAFLSARFRKFTFAPKDVFAGAVAVAFAFLIAMGGGSSEEDTENLAAVAFTIAVIGGIAIARRWPVIFLALFLPAMIFLSLLSADVVAPLKSWELTGPLLLFLVLLTLLNAPFDWASLGLTRALLRRGLELGGWWPYLLALVDACLAGVIIAILALIMVIGVQAFDELAVHGGGKYAAVLPLGPLFDGISTNPGAPEYWWAYALLLSTMIPSLINLAIAGTAFTRGIPGLPRLLLLWTPEGRDVPDYKRPFVAAGLTLQIFAGAFLGLAAQALLAWGLVFHLMPWIGLDLLGMARAVAAYDLPARVGQLFIGLR